MMRIHTTNYLVQSLKSSSIQSAIKNGISGEHRALFSTSFCLSRKDESRIRSTPKLDAIFPNVMDFPNRHIGPRKYESKAMLNELGFNVS